MSCRDNNTLEGCYEKICKSMNRGRTAKKRVLLSYDVSLSNDGAWTPRITTKQVKLRHKSEGVEGSVSDVVTLPVCATQEQAQRLCEATTPPLWAGGNDKKECVICFGTEGILNKLHHCRNCGYYVCKKCSSKSWPASMVPTTYINKENFIRVCDSCSCLVEAFVDGLVTGDMTKTMAIYSYGNINLNCPFSIYESAPYPVHCAAQGGNLDILRWLLEDRMCPIKSPGEGPLMTTEGMSVFAIAAYYGHVSIMRYVVHRHGAAVTEISEASVLHRALHAALEAPGPLPDTASSGKGILRMKKIVIPREDPKDEGGRYLRMAGAAVAAGALGYVFAPIIVGAGLSCVGFTSTGIAAGSFAAASQAAVGNVVAGSWIATCTSLGMTGAAATATGGAAVGAVGGAAAVAGSQSFKR